jgi:ferric-dicitrate binding protein FerR (iron transport regulator)
MSTMNEQHEHIDYPELIIRYLTGEAGTEEIRMLEQWVGSDPAHADLFREYKQSWTLANIDRPNKGIDVDKEWKTLSSRLFDKEKDRARIVPLQRKYPYARVWQIAAAFVVLVASAFLVYYLTKTPGSTEFIASDSIKTMMLPDGSEVTLNRHSSLLYSGSFNKDTREVSLEGAAYFDVATNPAKPFIIKTNDITIRVTGTSFYVNGRKEDPDVEVVVNSGQVSVAAAHQNEVLLEAGEKAVFSRSTGELTKAGNTDPNFISWKTNHLVFSEDRLDEVISTVNETYFCRIQIASPEISNCRLTATFDNQSLETVLEVLQETFDLSIQMKGGEILIAGEGCE